MAQNNKIKLYEALKSEGYDNFKSQSDFDSYIHVPANRKKLFDALKQEGFDNFSDEKSFDDYLGYADSEGSVSNQVVAEYDASVGNNPVNRMKQLINENKVEKSPSLRQMVKDKPQVAVTENVRPTVSPSVDYSKMLGSERHSYIPERIEPIKRDKEKELEEKELDANFKAKPVQSDKDIFDNYMGRFSNTRRGIELETERAEIQAEVESKYISEFKNSPEYKEITGKKYDTQEEANKALSDAFYGKYGKTINNEMRPYMDAINKEMFSRYGYNINEEMRKLNKRNTSEQVNDLEKEVGKLLEEKHDALRHRGGSGGNAMNALMGSTSYNQSTAAQRQEIGALESAQRLLEQSQEIIAEAGKKDNTNFVGGLARGFRDNMDWENFTLGLAEMADAKYLNNALEKADKGEQLTPAEEKLLEASVTNMATQAYFSSDLGRGYGAGQTTAVSLPFMLEFIANPISGSGNAIAKSLLKFGLKKFGRKAAGKGALNSFGRALTSKGGKMAGRLVGDAGAAIGMEGTTGVGRVAAGTLDRLNENYDYSLDDNGNLQVKKVGNTSLGGALARSAASTFLEHQSEMVFNAFRGWTPFMKAADNVLPGRVSEFMNRIKNSKPGQLYSELKNNPTFREMVERAQFRGLPEEYMEEVYNNFANVAIGEMSVEDAVDLDNNINTFLGLAPTSAMFAALGLGGMAHERLVSKRKMSKIFGKFTDEQKHKFEELQRMSKEVGNTDIREFIKMIIADESLSQEEKRAEIEYAFELAKQNAMDDIQSKQPENERAADEAYNEGTEMTPEQHYYAEQEKTMAGEALRNADAGLFETVEGLLEDTKSQGEIDNLVNGLSDEQKALVLDYIEKAKRVDGILDAALEEAIDAGDNAANALNDAIVEDENGNRTITTALYKDGTVYVLADDGKHATILRDGKKEMVASERLENLQRSDADEFIRKMKNTILEDKQKALNNSLNHHSKTQEPQAGMQLWNGDVPFIVTDVSADGVVQAFPSERDDKTGQMVPKKDGLVNMTVEEAKNLQDDYYKKMAAAEKPEAEGQPFAEPQRKKVLSDGRVAVQTGADEREASFDVLDRGGNVVDSGAMPIAEFETLKDYIPEDESVDNTSENQAENASSPETGESKLSETDLGDANLIPVDEKGNVLYYQVPVEVTVADLTDGTLDNAEIDGFVSANQVEANKLLDKVKKSAPKIGTNKAKYLEDKKAWQAKVDEARQQSDYWKEVSAFIKQQREQPGDKVAEEIMAMGESLDGLELAAQRLAGGNLPLLYEDYKRELGFGDKEAGKMFGLFKSRENGGLTIEEAGELLMQDDLEAGTNFFDPSDANAGRNAILDVLSSARTRGDLTEFIRKNREAMAERERSAEEEHEEMQREAWAQENFGMSYADYVTFNEVIDDIIREKAIPEEEIREFYNTFAEELNNWNNGRVKEETEGNDRGPDSEGGESGEGVLPDEQLGDTGGVEADAPTETDVNADNEGVPAPEESVTASIEEARKEVAPNPTDAQKEAGNYKKGHVKIDGYDITIENPKGSERSGTDANGNKWSVTMNNDYGYIRGTEGVDGDHIDVFLSDFPTQGHVYVVDQLDVNTGKFDEHKVMYGFGSIQEATDAYLSNYSPGWMRIGAVTEVSKDEFKKWIDSSHRKTKPFAEYKSVKTVNSLEENDTNALDVARDRLANLEQEWRDRILDYIAEHYPTQATVSAQTNSPKGIREKTAMKEDEILKRMRSQARDEINDADEKVMALSKSENAGTSNARFREVESDKIASFATKHNINESDVRKYAQSMKVKNLGGASYAFKSISRSIRLLNSDLSLGQFVKVFSPIKKELYENFGDIDALREEYIQREMENRNVMEAARKRAEEEAEAERKRLEEFELMSDEEMDAAYFKALETNDKSRMRDIVNEAARRKGYVSEDEFRMAHRAPSYDEEGIDKSMVDVAANKDQIRESLNEQFRMNRDKYKDESAAAINSVLDAIDKGDKPTVTIYRAVPKSLKEGKVRNGDWVSLSESYVKVHGEHVLNGNYRIMKEEVPAENLYWDGNDINEWGYDDRSDYRYKDTKNNRKLNDLITRDNKGDVIPPSKRFNARKADPRFRFIGERGAENLDKVEEATTRLDNLAVARDMEKEFNAKKERIAKLRESKPVEITGKEYEGKYELNRDSAQKYILDNLRGEYTINDTGEKVKVSKKGAKKVTSHSQGNEAHMKSIAAIPELIGNAVFIEERHPYKKNAQYDSFRYYVTGLKIGGEDYTVRITIGVKKGEFYYDHYLTEIEKGNLIEVAQSFKPTEDTPNPSYAENKDSILISILQTNDKENARKIKMATGWERGADGKWRYEVDDFEIDMEGLARKNRLYSNLLWGKEYDTLSNKLFDGVELTEEEISRFDELSEKVNELRRTYEESDVRYLDDYVKDEKLFEAYPELKQVRVEMYDAPTSNTGATWYSNQNLIRVNEAALERVDFRSILAHEVQHAVQSIEGFARGGNSTAYRNHLDALKEKRDAWSMIEEFDRKRKEFGEDASQTDIYNALRDEYLSDGFDFGDGFIPSRDAFDKGFNLWVRGYDKEGYEDAYNEYQYLTGKFGLGASNDRYKELSGEVEARNVQNRMDMSPEQRRATLAEETEDVAREDQIFLNDAFEEGNTLSEMVTEKNVEQGKITRAIEDLSSSLHTPVKIARTLDDVSDAAARRAIGQGRAVKAWFDPNTGEVVVYLPNATDVNDAVKSVLHEVVGHKGLRELLGKDNFDDAMMELYRQLPVEARNEMADVAVRKYNGNVAIAMDEYLAEQAEKDETPTWWDKVVSAIRNLLRKVGVNVELSEGDVRYLLWRNRKKLEDGDALDLAEDVMMRYKNGIGEYEQVSDSGTRFREADDVPIREKAMAREHYERVLNTAGYKMQESWQDSMLGLKEAQEAIAKATHSRIMDYENAYMAENALSSTNLAEMEAYSKLVFKPLLDEVNALIAEGAEYGDVSDYLMAKHGIERNREMAVRKALGEDKETMAENIEGWNETKQAVWDDGSLSWREKQEKLDAIAEKEFGADLSNDYSGLSAVFDEAEDWQEEAYGFVEGFEEKFKPSFLMEKVNEATDAILTKQRESGLISADTMRNIQGMYQYYVPLRGFKVTTADEVYDYLTTETSSFSAPVRTARGRRSAADDPIATIANVAESGIVQGNKNLMKQKFLTMAQNHRTDLVSVDELWVKENEVTGEWEAVFPDIPSNATPRQVEQIVEDFNKRMEELSKEEKPTVKRSRDAVNIPYKILPHNLKEHQVIVKRGGKSYVLTINGNPRAAQALNGMTNPDASDSPFLKALNAANRFMAQNFTVRNPAFVVSNLFRDGIYANSTIWIKESPVYAKAYNKNWVKSVSEMAGLVKRYKNNTLDLNNPTDKMFAEFIANGGETGYTFIKSVDDYKGIIAKELKKSQGGKMSPAKAIDVLGDAMDTFGRWAEDTSRFTAYRTSREMGRSIARSVSDAKEISVNFNKKGAGAKTAGKLEKGNRLNAIQAWASQSARGLYIFWNAGVQGLANFSKLANANKGKFAGLVSAYYVLGSMMPVLNMVLAQALGGDDDDYYDLPEYVRRTNICLYAGGEWITIPLPIELRAVYGLGELTCGALSGKDDYTPEELGVRMAEQVSQILPIDMLEGEGGFSAFVPSYVKPLWEAYVTNKDWTGIPIYKENDFNRGMPEWTKAYSGTSPELVKLAKTLNAWSGGSKYRPGRIDVNPARVEHLFESYLGGVGTTLNQAKKMVMMPVDEEMRELRNVPILSRFVRSADERAGRKRIDELYYRNVERFKKIGQEYNGYRKELNNPKNSDVEFAEYTDLLNKLENSEEFQKYLLFKEDEKELKRMRDAFKESGDEEIEGMMYAKKAEMNEALR